MTPTIRPLALLVFGLLGSAGLVAAQAPGEPLPPRSFQRLGTSKLRHGSRILCLAYSPDAQILAAGGGNDPVRLWNPKTGALIGAINEPWVNTMAFTASGETLLFAGFHKTVRLWSIKQNKELGRLEGHKAAIKAIAVSPDTSVIASGSQDGAIYLWDWNVKRKVADLVGHTDEVTALAFAQDGGLLVSGGSDRLIFVWDTATNQFKHKLDAGCGVLAIAFSADGNTLFSAGDDYLIRRWDVVTGKQTGVFKGHDGIIVSLFVQGDTLISGALDKTVRFWDAKSTKQLRSLPRGTGDCDALTVTKAGDFLAMAGLNNTIRIFDAASGKEAIATPGQMAPLAGLALSADNKRLASVRADGQVIVWEAQTGKLAKTWDSKQTGEFHLAFAGDSKTLAIAANSVRLWNTDTGAEIAQLPTKPFDPIVALAFSPDGKLLALGLHSAQIELWNLKDKKTVHTIKYPDALHALAWSPDGKTLAAAGGAKIFLYDPQSAHLVRSFDVKDGPAPAFPLVASLAFGPDSNTLAAGGFDATIRIFNLNAKNPSAEKERQLCEGHQSAVYAIAFSKDGRSLVSGSFDKTVRLWETFSGKQIALFKGHIGEVMGVGFLRDGRSVYSAGTDTVVYRWDVPGLSNNGQLPDLTLAVGELDAAWNLLSTEETPRGHEAMWRCVASAQQAIAHMIREKKVYLLDPDRVKKLFRDLDASHYPTRSAAMNELAGYGRWMEGRYDEAMANAPSLEYKRRVEILKEKLNATESPSLVRERLRVRRYMLMCEQVGSADALAALRMLAEKGPEEELRAEAKASLRRLGKK
jgi:WD40 repeat protein